MQRIMVTGACGFLGRRVVSLGKDAGLRIVATDLDKHAMADPDVAYVPDALRNVEQLSQWIDDTRPDAILHLAGCVRRDVEPDVWQACVEANVTPLTNLLTAIAMLPAAQRPVLVVPGSQSEYGSAAMPWTEHSRSEPGSAYGASKLAATVLLSAAIERGVVKGCTLRLPIVYGPGQKAMFVPDLILSALRGDVFDMTAGEQKRRFVYVDDVAKMLLYLAGRLADGGEVPTILNAPASAPVSLLALAETIVAITGDASVLNPGGVAYRADEALEVWPDTTLAETMGFEPLLSLSTALGETVAWYREHLSEM
jgi:UDP-glucose 4-epimerase